MSGSVLMTFLKSSDFDYQDDEVEGWFVKLQEEMDVKGGFKKKLNQLKIRRECFAEYLPIESKMLSDYKDVCETYDLLKHKLEENNNDSSLCKTEINDLIVKLETFNLSLQFLKKFINLQVYADSKIEYFYLKIKDILSAILNFFLNRNLSSSKTYVGEHFYAHFYGPATYEKQLGGTVLSAANEPRFFVEEICHGLSQRAPNLPISYFRSGSEVSTSEDSVSQDSITNTETEPLLGKSFGP